MAVIQVVQDTPTVFDSDVNQASITVECSVVGFHVYMRIVRAGAILGDWKVQDGAPPIQFVAIRHDQVIANFPTGTGSLTVNRV